MKTKTYLEQIKWLNRRIENKVEEVSQLRVMAMNISSQKFDKERVQSSFEPDKIGAAVTKIYDLEREIDALVDKFIDKRALIIEQIDHMDDVELYHVLTKRYVAFKDFSDIAHDMSYTERHVERLHGKALAAFEKKYGETYLNGEKKSCRKMS